MFRYSEFSVIMGYIGHVSYINLIQCYIFRAPIPVRVKTVNWVKTLNSYPVCMAGSLNVLKLITETLICTYLHIELGKKVYGSSMRLDESNILHMRTTSYCNMKLCQKVIGSAILGEFKCSR